MDENLNVCTCTKFSRTTTCHVPSSSRLSNVSCSSSSPSRAVSLSLSAAEYGARNMHTPPTAAHHENAMRDQMSTKTELLLRTVGCRHEQQRYSEGLARSLVDHRVRDGA